MKPLRIIFMGTPEFAVPSLKCLTDSNDKVVAVVCQPDKPKGRGRKMLPPPVKQEALASDIPVLQPKSIKTDEFLQLMSSYDPDLIVVTAYGKFLPDSLLELPPMGCINVHASLLPKYRGPAPIQWALINGETETGVTIMNVDSGMDTGDILLQNKLAISDEDTSGSLFARLSVLGGKTLVQAIDKLKNNEITPVVQDDSLSCMAPMLSKEQGTIDWSRPAKELHCLIRGLDPWPSAYSFVVDTRYRFFSPVLVELAEQPAGKVCRIDKEGLLVATGRDGLLFREIQVEGKKRMPVQSWLCGNPALQVGDIFGQK